MGEDLITKMNDNKGCPYCVSYFNEIVVKHPNLGWGISKSQKSYSYDKKI